MGQKYAAFDAEGQITGFYDSIDSPPPENLDIIEITDDEWLMLLTGSGYTIVDGAIVDPPPAEEIPLAVIKIGLKAKIDADAEAERLKYITSGAGQALTYMQKSDEARRYLAEETPTGSDYPLLSAEVGITGGDVRDVALVVSGAYAQWQLIGAQIEAVRLGTKAAIEVATNAADAQAAYGAAVWPST
ncbi:hypothetical protein G6L86_02630 [Agrobacterium tumefaciens]|uniref:hypothetical protein n=1 Tax=Agrobacterium tumefaciens TaxID=358 RepID=UPI0015734E5D|nr:hypothetical protein [Agrobacterium tumefaciens]NSX84472.1 hypothetical protein [Agrobacterium tumefaciens]